MERPSKLYPTGVDEPWVLECLPEGFALKWGVPQGERLLPEKPARLLRSSRRIYCLEEGACHTSHK